MILDDETRYNFNYLRLLSFSGILSQVYYQSVSGKRLVESESFGFLFKMTHLRRQSCMKRL